MRKRQIAQFKQGLSDLFPQFSLKKWRNSFLPKEYKTLFICYPLLKFLSIELNGKGGSLCTLPFKNFDPHQDAARFNSCLSWFPVHRRGQQLLLHPTKWSYIKLYTIFSQLNKLRLVLVFSITLRESFLPRSLLSSVLPWVSFVLFYSFFFFSVRYQKWNWMSWFADKLSLSLSVICLLVITKKKKDWCFT